MVFIYVWRLLGVVLLAFEAFRAFGTLLVV